MSDVSNSDFGVNVQDYSYIPDSQDNVILNALKYTKVSFVVLLLIVIGIYVGIFFLLGNGNDANTSPLKNLFIIILEIVLWVLLIYVVYVNIVNYNNSNDDFKTNMMNLFNSSLAELQISSQSSSDTSSSDTSSSDTSSSSTTCDSNTNGSNEVFHIPNNLYTYEDAILMCEKYDARLANYDEIESAYNNGANWCSYGWSKEQMALFPTQKAIYNQLKKIPGHEHDCGRPGINGGYINNPNVKFGVNCYGVKPKPNANDESYMHSLNHTPSGIESNKTDDDLANSLLAPFNKNIWSRFSDSSSSSSSSSS